MGVVTSILRKQRPEQKIDAAIALLMAMGRAMTDDSSAAGLEASSPANLRGSQWLRAWSADGVLFSMRSWRTSVDLVLRLDDFEGQDCDLAVDLARETDFIAILSMDIAPRPTAAPESAICRIHRRETTLFGTRVTAWKTTGVAL